MIGRWLAARAEAERVPLRTAEPEIPVFGPDPTRNPFEIETDLPEPDYVLRFNGDVDADQVAEVIQRFAQRGRIIGVELDPRPTLLDHVWRWVAGPALAGICVGLGIIGAYGLIDALTRWAAR